MIDPACGSGHFLLGSFRRILGPLAAKRAGGQHPRPGAADARQHPRRGHQSLRRGHRPLPAAAGGHESVRRDSGWPTPRRSTSIWCAATRCCTRVARWPAGHRLRLIHDQAFDHAYQARITRACPHPEAWPVPCRGGQPALHHAQGSGAQRRLPGTVFDLPWPFCSLQFPSCNDFFNWLFHGGFTGQITANSFMKREFGKKLIEEYFLATVPG